AAESSWLPLISATGTVNRDFGVHQDTSGAITSIDQTTKDAAINLSWTLYDFGARGARIQGARRRLDAAAFAVNSTSQQTLASVVQSYYSVVAADQSLSAATTTESVARHSFEIARALREGGVESVADVLQAETAYDQAAIARIQAGQTAKTSRGALAVAMG